MSSFSTLFIGVDPGLLTGLSWLCIQYTKHDDVPRPTITVVETEPLNACTIIHDLMHDHSGRIIIAVERYNIMKSTARMTRQYDALEIIGTCRWLASRYNAEFILQSASAAQRAGNNDILRQLQWWTKGKDHCNKSTSQVVLAIQRAFPQEYMNILHIDM